MAILSGIEREEIRQYLEDLVGEKVNDPNIRSIVVNPVYRSQPVMKIEVGKYYSELEPGRPREKVVAIFESKAFLVCTEQRGAGHNLPYIFTRDTVRKIEKAD